MISLSKSVKEMFKYVANQLEDNPNLEKLSLSIDLMYKNFIFLIIILIFKSNGILC